MSLSSIESLPEFTKDELEENAKKEENNELKENAQKEENNELVLVLEEKATIMNPKDDISVDIGVASNFLGSKKKMKYWYIALLCLRIAAFVFCLISFSLMSANEQRVVVDETIDGVEYTVTYQFRWYSYSEFKYVFSANVLGFVYSGVQICYLVKYMITKKHTLNPKLQGYWTVAIDQVMAYILLSASSSAAAISHMYKSFLIERNALKFVEMTSASIAMSFFAFKAFAVASFVSGYILSKFT